MTLHRIELLRGPLGSAARADVIQTIRFARRLRQRHIAMNVLSVFADQDGVSIEVGRRVVQITPYGDLRPSMRSVFTSHGWRADPNGMAAYRTRMQAMYLDMAADARRRYSPAAGRVMVNNARFDRLHGGPF